MAPSASSTTTPLARRSAWPMAASSGTAGATVSPARSSSTIPMPARPERSCLRPASPGSLPVPTARPSRSRTSGHGSVAIVDLDGNCATRPWPRRRRTARRAAGVPRVRRAPSSRPAGLRWVRTEGPAASADRTGAPSMPTTVACCPPRRWSHDRTDPTKPQSRAARRAPPWRRRPGAGVGDGPLAGSGDRLAAVRPGPGAVVPVAGRRDPAGQDEGPDHRGCRRRDRHARRCPCPDVRLRRRRRVDGRVRPERVLRDQRTGLRRRLRRARTPSGSRSASTATGSTGAS